MPKEIVHMKQFHGGINDAAENTDIADHECQIADSCDLSSIGKITLTGDLKGTDTAPPSQVSVTTPGSGLFAFRSDRAADGDNITCNCYATHNANLVRVWDSDHNTWTSITTSSEWSDSSDCDVEFLFHEGILRQSDAQLVAGNQRRWWGYINRNHFGSSGSQSDSYTAAMYSHDADLATPTGGAIQTGTTCTDAVMNIDLNKTANDGFIPAATYDVAYSFVYDHHQESLLQDFGSDITVAENEKFEVPQLYFHTLNSRIVGARVYIKRKDTADSWLLLIDVDLIKGARLGLNDPYIGAWSGSSNAAVLTMTATNITELGTETYRGINGHAFDEPIDCSYKTAVVVDGITYAGNYMQNGLKYPDSVIKCSSTFIGGIHSDKFPESNKLDVTPNDGDEIVKLEAFQDKVLVFKRQTLLVVNYSPEQGDYIDGTYPFMGIRHKGHSFPTAHGIVFMNDLGVHLYDGETVKALSDRMQDLTIPPFTSTAGANDVPEPEVNFYKSPEPESSGSVKKEDIESEPGGQRKVF